jgi:hypothetical protein
LTSFPAVGSTYARVTLAVLITENERVSCTLCPEMLTDETLFETPFTETENEPAVGAVALRVSS